MFDSRRIAARAEGFTLIEALAGMLASSVALSAFTSFYLTQQRVFVRERIEVAASQSVQSSVELIVRDLRLSGFDPTNSGNFGLTTATSNAVAFAFDEDLDGVLDTSERRYYGLDSSTGVLESCVTAGASCLALADFIDTMTFRYYDAAGNELTTPVTGGSLAAVRRINVSVVVDRGAPHNGPQIRHTVVGSAAVRN